MKNSYVKYFLNSIGQKYERNQKCKYLFRKSSDEVYDVNGFASQKRQCKYENPYAYL